MWEALLAVKDDQKMDGREKKMRELSVEEQNEGEIKMIIIIILVHYHERLKCQRIFPTSGFIELARPSLDHLFLLKSHWS